jgi:hypothetical protein
MPVLKSIATAKLLFIRFVSVAASLLTLIKYKIYNCRDC